MHHRLYLFFSLILYSICHAAQPQPQLLKQVDLLRQVPLQLRFLKKADKPGFIQRTKKQIDHLQCPAIYKDALKLVLDHAPVSYKVWKDGLDLISATQNN